MNIVDIIILVIIGVSIILGMHRGFINGVLSMAALILALFISFSVSGEINDRLQENKTLVNTLSYYTDATSKIGDIDLSMTALSDVNQNVITSLLEKVDLPEVIEKIFVGEIKAVGQRRGTLADLLNRTIVDVTIAIISFLICFFVSYVILLILVHMIVYVFELPILRHFDTLIGGIFGFIRGVLYIFIISTLVPVVMAIAPIPQIQEVYEGSQLMPLFDSSIVMMILNQIFA